MNELGFDVCTSCRLLTMGEIVQPMFDCDTRFPSSGIRVLLLYTRDSHDSYKLYYSISIKFNVCQTLVCMALIL